MHHLLRMQLRQLQLNGPSLSQDKEQIGSMKLTMLGRIEVVDTIPINKPN